MNKKFNLQNIIITIIVTWLLLFVFIPNVMIIGTSFLTRDEANLIEMTFTMDGEMFSNQDSSSDQLSISSSETAGKSMFT